MESTLWVPIIAGGFGLMTLHINKRNKVSEFRQAWIDAIREELSLFSSAARTLGSLLHQGQEVAAGHQSIGEWVRKVDAHNRDVMNKGYLGLRVDAEEQRKHLLQLQDIDAKVDAKLDACLDVCRKNYYKILLRLNLVAHDPLHLQMDAHLQSVLKMLDSGLQRGAFAYDSLLHELDELMKVSAIMLKQEWERVKAGDFFYRVRAKYRQIGASSFNVVRD